MQKNIFIYGMLILGILACNSAKEKKVEDNAKLSGHYINQTFLNYATDSIIPTIPNYCLEMIFTGNDSVRIASGFEKFELAYSKKNDSTYALKQADASGDMLFVMHSDGTLSLLDTGYTQRSGASQFTKTNDTATGERVFKHYINERVIAGVYANNGATVTFSANGKVTGLGKFTEYEICLGGDCAEMPEGPDDSEEIKTWQNVIYLSDSTGNGDFYVFSGNKKTGVVDIYKLAPPIKDIKGNRKIKEKLVSLHKVD